MLEIGRLEEAEPARISHRHSWMLTSFARLFERVSEASCRVYKGAKDNELRSYRKIIDHLVLVILIPLEITTTSYHSGNSLTT